MAKLIFGGQVTELEEMEGETLREFLARAGRPYSPSNEYRSSQQALGPDDPVGAGVVVLGAPTVDNGG